MEKENNVDTNYVKLFLLWYSDTILVNLSNLYQYIQRKRKQKRMDEIQTESLRKIIEERRERMGFK